MASHVFVRGALLYAALLGTSIAATAAPPASSHGAARTADLQAQVKDVDAQIAAARAHNTALQAQVAQMEQRNATQQKQVQQRDAEIAALQRKLQAAGVPTSAATGGH